MSKHRKDDCQKCPTCEQSYFGPIQLALAEAQVRNNDFDQVDVSNLAFAQYQQGNYGEALKLYNTVLGAQSIHYGINHPDVASAYVKYVMLSTCTFMLKSRCVQHRHGTQPSRKICGGIRHLQESSRHRVNRLWLGAPRNCTCLQQVNTGPCASAIAN